MTKPEDSKNLQEIKKVSNKLENNRKVTHSYLNDRYLTTINHFNGYVNLTVLYLHNNCLDKIQNLKPLSNLKSLYLQRNKIRKIENLDSLVKLKRLYLGHNEISVVENLECLRNLEELHIEKQNLIDGEALCFDPRSIQSLSECLQVLNISSNNITTIQMLLPLWYLRSLNASNNNIKYLQNITDNIKQFMHLTEANFSGNPVCKEHRYRETIIGKSNYLKTLDGKDITNINRLFMKQFEIEKSNFKNRDLTTLPKNIDNMAKNYPLPIQKAVSNFMLKPSKSAIESGLQLNSSDSGAYIPWKSMPKSFSSHSRMIPPLLRKQKKRNECRTVNLHSFPNSIP